MTLSQITIGTRASKLALWQAEHVKSLIEKQFSIPVNLKKISTKGDRILDRSLMDIGGKGLFLKEIEDELFSGSVDIAVHSMKDVPYEMPPGLIIAAILKREDPSDAFVSNKYSSIDEMPKASVVGTSSLRRMEQLKQTFPHLSFQSLRGNVDTRLKKLDQEEYDAVILASAGLIRLGFSDRIAQRLSIIPSVGQGAVGIECKQGRSDIVNLIEKLNHTETMKAVRIERHVAEKFKASCQTPFGCHVRQDPDDSQKFRLQLFHAKSDGSDVMVKEIFGKWEDGEELITGLSNPK